MLPQEIVVVASTEEELNRLVGYYVADGYVRHGTPTFSLVNQANTPDREYLYQQYMYLNDADSTFLKWRASKHKSINGLTD